MKLSYRYPPHIRANETNFSVMGGMVIALAFQYILACYFYQMRVLVSMVLSVAVCVACDILSQLLARRKIGVADLSPVVTGMIIPLLLPASVSYYIIVAAGMFAILVVKQPFGGLGQNIFNPAAGGIAFVAITWPTSVFSYPMPRDVISVTGQAAMRLVNSPAYRLKMGATPSYSFLDMLLGNFPGPMGATNILVLITCLLFLIAFKSASGRMAVSFLASCGIFAFLFPRISTGRIQSVMYELLSGALLFAAVFLINDPSTAPKRGSSQLIYAAVAGVVTMLFRYFGGFEESVFFALLLMNPLVWLFDVKIEGYHSKQRRRARGEKQFKEV